jgi:hypothetical protein
MRIEQRTGAACCCCCCWGCFCPPFFCWPCWAAAFCVGAMIWRKNKTRISTQQRPASCHCDTLPPRRHVKQHRRHRSRVANDRHGAHGQEHGKSSRVLHSRPCHDSMRVCLHARLSRARTHARTRAHTHTPHTHGRAHTRSCPHAHAYPLRLHHTRTHACTCSCGQLPLRRPSAAHILQTRSETARSPPASHPACSP